MILVVAQDQASYTLCPHVNKRTFFFLLSGYTINSELQVMNFAMIQRMREEKVCRMRKED